MTNEFYQLLVDRGWRRSGTILYKPDLKASCCQQYTIRLDSEKFRPSKDQRKCINRFNKHILGDSYIKEAARLHPLSREQAKRRDTEFDLVARIHEGERSILKTPPEPAHDLTVELETDDFTEEKYILFEQYQRLVHHEPPIKISERSFTNFLCNSPLQRREVNGRKLGSYHQCYRIDGILVAVGFLDLLPSCVSGVYFIYHDSFSKFSFGKLGALREIALAMETGSRYWYAGFYIHVSVTKFPLSALCLGPCCQHISSDPGSNRGQSCPKMLYKGDFAPQSILDPESYEWDTMDKEMKNKLERQKYVSLSRERSRAASAISPVNGTDVEDQTDTPMIDVDCQPDEDDGSTEVKDPTIPIFARSMPGVLTRQQVLDEIDLDNIKLRLGVITAVASDLIKWEESDIDDNRSIKGLVAEMAAAVGPEIAKELTVYFR